MSGAARMRHELQAGNGYVHSTVLYPSGNRVALHRTIASKAAGIDLFRSFYVHHINDNKADNAHRNLVVLESNSEHGALHYRRSVLRAGGDPWNDVWCGLCRGLHGRDESYHVSGGGWRGRECYRIYNRAWKRLHRDEINRKKREARKRGPITVEAK